MGSITKKPKAPTITYVLPSEPTPVTAETVISSEPVKTDAEVQAEARTESLLRRSRGRFGTIATSFKGFLDSANSERNQQKTLLGE